MPYVTVAVWNLSKTCKASSRICLLSNIYFINSMKINNIWLFLIPNDNSYTAKLNNMIILYS